MPALASLALFVNVLTYQYDTTRAGANTQETLLTPANVNASQFGKLFAHAVDGYIYGQPLYFAGVSIPGQGTHNVVFVATEHDSVYAFDADSGAAPLWHVSFLSASVTTVPASDTGCDQIVPEIGITSTPVIDPEAGTIYVVAMTRESGGYVHRLHALDVATGAERSGSPVVIEASVQGSGEGGSTVVFRARNYKQRPGLLLLHGVVYTLWSSHCDIGAYHGWVLGYDAQTLRQVAVYNSTPNGNEGSFWNGGAAPAADAAGNLYLVSGNGTFDFASGGPDLGESFLKLSTAGGLSVTDYFTPFNYEILNREDVDTGSSGVAFLGDEAGSSAHPHLLAGAGKEGRVYLLDRDNLGHWNAGADSQIVQSLPGVIGGLFGNPAYFNRRLYFCGSGNRLLAFPVSDARMAAAPESQSSAVFGYPGCVPTISANGVANGVVWVIDPAGILRAYDSANLARELYDSNQNRARDALPAAVKFSVPAVANGKVFAGTQTALVVYGLLSQAGTIAVSNAASGTAPLAPGAIASLYGSGLPASASVTVNGVPAPVFAAIASQINFQVPFEIPVGAATVNLLASGAVVATTSIAVESVAPGLFTQPDGTAAALNQDFSVNAPGRPAAPGTVLAAYLTGLGPVDPAVPTGTPAPPRVFSRTKGQVTAAIGDLPATVEFAGLAPGYAGLYQVNVRVPASAPSGQYPLRIFIDGIAANPAPVNIR